MADFEQLRKQLRQTRSDLESADTKLAAARERIKRITAQETELDRVFRADNQDHVAQRSRLRQQKSNAQLTLDQQLNVKAGGLAAEADVLQKFVPLTDPRDGVSRLNDSVPILLMPVRIETRFKTVAVPGAAAPLDQLWVRIFPDDCWIDSFDPALTETEIVNAKTYWTAIWQAGGVEDQERGAWRGLATSHGSGRASWIVQQYRPSNLSEKPIKPNPQDVVLTIPTDTPLSPTDSVAAVAFWGAAWLADGDATAAELAQQNLINVVGVNRAERIISSYQPVNFATPIAAGIAKDELNIIVAFVVFPETETKSNAWSRAPRMPILPDRFVFVGYQDNEPPLVVLGNPVPSNLAAGPDPSLPEKEQLQNDKLGNLAVPDELKWIGDFDRALQIGMGLRIPLTKIQARSGFNRVLVIGLRLNADDQAAKAELETLFLHHSFSRKGLSVVPQGTPTNNTELSGSGYGRMDDPDESFDDRKAPLFLPETSWLDKRDGQWIAEYLGIDPAPFANVHHAGATDQLTERAMNVALWPTTLGYWMETMMAPVFPRDTIDQTRDFFNRYVIASGAIPAIRIGRQPYGILPATTISRMHWLRGHFPPEVAVPDPSLLSYLHKLYPLLLAIDADWQTQRSAVSFIGKQGGDPHQILLDIVGLHSGSVEWAQRYAESVKTLLNRLKVAGIDAGKVISLLKVEMEGSLLLQKLGYSGATTPPILEKVFAGKHNLLNGGVIDDRPLSEIDLIRAYTTPAGKNYVEWLIEAASTSLDALYRQDGFIDDKPPTALLYLLLRHALQLGYHDISIRLHENAGLYTLEQAAVARVDDPFLHIRSSNRVSESRYQPLYAIKPEISGNNTQTVADFIAINLNLLEFATYVREQIAAMERLKSQPTARLERAFADHLDCCSYRLDAWLLGIVNFQLASMRKISDGQDTPPRAGIYIGAYGWLEDLKPEHKTLTPVSLRPDLANDFAGPDEIPLMRDDKNQGYIHAPSLNHAVAAAVLRNGYISDASAQNRQTMAINLTSERVRTALAMLEGIRAGQSLADLLGYQFERGLHDRHDLVEVDKFIYPLRKAFPLRSDHLKSTKTDEGVSIEAIEARNVMDGLALVDHIKTTGIKTYPFGKSSLPDPSDEEAAAIAAINAEVDRILESHDAVADLALAEGVYQAVLGNYDRVASTYDAYARGHFPPEPDVIRTPFEGIGITHRVGLHLDASANPTESPIAGIDMTPRAQAEPAVNRWLAAILPPLDEVGCVVTFRDTTGAVTAQEITLDQLGLQPADLTVLIHDDHRQAMTELDDRIVRCTVSNFNPRPDVPIAISYMEKQSASLSVFELMPLIRYTRRLVTKSRPLKATDMALMNEAQSGQDSGAFADKQRFVLVNAAMQTLHDDLAALEAQMQAQLADLTNHRAVIVTGADGLAADIVELLARAASFAIPQAGWGFVYDYHHRTYSAILRQCSDLVARWDDRTTEFDALIAEYDALPIASSDEDRYRLLAQAEQVISTLTTTPPPAPPDTFRTNLVDVTRFAFVAKRDQFAAVQNTDISGVSLLLNHIATLLPVAAFDLREFVLTAQEDAIVRFAEDVMSATKVIRTALARRLSASQKLFDKHDNAAIAADRLRALEDAARVLLGEDFRIVPQFRLGALQGDEAENALAAGQSGTLFTDLAPLHDFPVDTWLYGVARVREKMHAWEQMVVMAGSFDRPEPLLDVMQLPFIPDDRWLALELSPGQKFDTHRLLYTAHFSVPFDKTLPQCGVLVDEWSEVIPGNTADTGITFHHDRPNCEAPQTMLLLTPPEFRGAWQWNDIVDTLNETLDFAKRRALEPKHIEQLPYAVFLPATIMATQSSQLTIAANLALNNKVSVVKQ